jgi:hypothetical protein
MANFVQRYEKGMLVGEGTTARVYKGVDLYTNESVAIKIAHGALAKHNRFVLRWQREVALLGKLQHPRIVPLIDANARYHQELYMIMQYAEGGSLHDRLYAGCLVRHALRWMYQILEGLSFIHSYGVVHQDIKPENVLLTADGDIWLADFSVARTRPELLINRQDITGTPEWYAPEQRMKVAAEIGPWTDLYSWGKILEQLSTSVGYRSNELAYIIDGCLMLDPQQRFRCASEIMPLLYKAIEHLPSNILRKRLRLQEMPRQIFILKNAFKVPEDEIPKWTKGAVASINKIEQNAFPELRSLKLLSLNSNWGIPESLLQKLWVLTQEVIQQGKTNVVFLVGEKELGKRGLARHYARLLSERGVMDNRILSYSKNSSLDDGYRGTIRQMLSPWGEDRNSFVQRLKRWLARVKQATLEDMGREAIALAKWSGFIEPNEATVDSGLGLVFLFQHLQRLAWKGGVSLILENPEYCTVSGDGLDICETVLSGVLGKRSMLLICTVSEEYLSENPKINAKVEALYQMGATKIQIDKLTDRQTISYIERFCHVPEKHRENVIRFCQGKVTLAKMLIKSLAFRRRCEWNSVIGKFALTNNCSIPKNMNDFLDQHLQEAFQWIEKPESAKEVLAVMLCSVGSVDQTVVNEINAQGVNELINVGIIAQKDRHLSFSIPQLRELLYEWLQSSIDFKKIHEKIALAWFSISEKKGLRYDMEIGRSFLLAGQPHKAIARLMYAAREAREARLWQLVEQIGGMIVQASVQNNSLVGKIEGLLYLTESQLRIGKEYQAEESLNKLKSVKNIDRQTKGRVAYLEAEVCISRKDWTAASQMLRQSQVWYADILDTRGQAQAFMRQGHLLFIHNKLQRAADRFAQVLRISDNDTLSWAETQARLVETRLRLGWYKGLHDDVERFLKIAQMNSDIHHMAYATYAAGLLLITQNRRSEGLYRLQTAQALSALCGDNELLKQSIENQGFIYFLQEDWERASFIQKKLIHFYNIRRNIDSMKVAQIRLHCTMLLRHPYEKESLQISNLEDYEAHTQYWWWVYQIINKPHNCKRYWANAKLVTEPRVWDLALYKTLVYIASIKECSVIRIGILNEVRERFQQRFK